MNRMDRNKYKSITAAAADLGLTRQAIYMRSKRHGVPMEEALTLGTQIRLTPETGTVNGTFYKSLRDFCNKTGSNYNYLYRRFNAAGRNLNNMINDVANERNNGLRALYERENTVLDITIHDNDLTVYATIRNGGGKVSIECNGLVKAISPREDFETFAALVVSAIAEATKKTIGEIETALTFINIARVQHDPIMGVTRITTRHI